MRTQTIGWLPLCALLGLGPWMTPTVYAQGVLSGLGRLAVEEAAIDDPRVPTARRVAQARALGHLGDERAAVSVLTTTLARRPSAVVRDAVLRSLAERRSAVAVPELLRALRGRIGGAPLIFDALVAIGGASVIAALSEISATGEPSSRELALRALARLSPETAASVLDQWFGDRNPAMRLAAFQIAAAHPNARWTDRLAQAVNDGSSPIAAEIITWSLARVAAGGGLPALLSIASHGVPLHCAVAIVACVRAYGDSIDAQLIDRAQHILRNESTAAPAFQWLIDADRQELAVTAAPRPDTTANRIELRRLLRVAGPTDAAARAAAAIELATLADPRAHVPLIAALSDPDPAVRRAVVRALAILDRDEARAALLRHAALEVDPEVGMLAEAGARRQSIAREDPWGNARSLLPAATDPSVDHGAPPLAR